MLGARVGQRAEDHALVAGDGEDEGAAEILPEAHGAEPKIGLFAGA